MQPLTSMKTLSPQDIAAIRQAYLHIFRRPPRQRLQVSMLWTVLGLAVLGSLWRTGFFDVAMMLKGLSKIGHVLHFMLPPAHHGWLEEFCYAMLETLAMAFIGTLYVPLC
jgi:phosphonate transport system permease protein